MRQIAVGVHMVQVGDMDVRRGTNGDFATLIETACTCGLGMLVVLMGVMCRAHVFRVVVRYSGHWYPSFVVRMANSDNRVT